MMPSDKVTAITYLDPAPMTSACCTDMLRVEQASHTLLELLQMASGEVPTRVVKLVMKCSGRSCLSRWIQGIGSLTPLHRQITLVPTSQTVRQETAEKGLRGSRRVALLAHRQTRHNAHCKQPAWPTVSQLAYHKDKLRMQAFKRTR